MPRRFQRSFPVCQGTRQVFALIQTRWDARRQWACGAKPLNQLCGVACDVCQDAVWRCADWRPDQPASVSCAQALDRIGHFLKQNRLIQNDRLWRQMGKQIVVGGHAGREYDWQARIHLTNYAGE